MPEQVLDLWPAPKSAAVLILANTLLLGYAVATLILQGVFMSIEALIDGMTRSEQLATLQLIWDRLTSSPEGTEPPDWHGDVLAQRVVSVKDGTANFVDWADAKKRLRERHG